MTRTQRIKAVVKASFVTGIVIGGIAGGVIGYGIGTGKLHIEVEPYEPCYAVKCEHYDRELMGGAKIYEKYYCCGTHGHDCSSY